MTSIPVKVENGKPIFGYNEEGEPICNSPKRNKLDDDLCQDTKTMPNGRCRRHGGLTPIGAANANFKTGRYSQHIPSHLAARFVEAVTDPQILDLSADIALGEVRISELLGKLSEQTALLDAIEGVNQQAEEGGTPQEIIIKVQKLAEQLKSFDTGLWAEIREAQEARRKLVEAERRRRKDMQAMVDLRQVIVLFSRIEDILTRCVTVQADKNIIGRELQMLSLETFGSVKATNANQDE